MTNKLKKKYGTIKGWAATKEGREKLSQIHLDEEYQKREINTKRKNKSFNTSKLEENFYEMLLKRFKEFDIVRQYNSIYYPYNCDFYIKSLDLYIECNYHWTHGKMMFNKFDKMCIEKLCIWEEKSARSDFYKRAIDVWTHRDINKINCAKQNKLNILFIYPKSKNNVLVIQGEILKVNGVMDNMRRQFLDLPIKSITEDSPKKLN